jgi:8-oxo-dGTP pyrophosphatase MutT (NUDIX family)
MDRTVVHASQDLTAFPGHFPLEAKMPLEKIRPIAICLCRDGDRILVAEYCEKGRLYYRPLGGTIEFGERGEQTIRREFREEIAADLTDVRYLGTLENIYTVENQRAHEIVLVYDGRFTDNNFYKKEVIQGDELGIPFKAVWKRIDEFGPKNPPLYPDGLITLFKK